ncbi:MAG: hypothetical protein A3J24_03915 [Deltaproteobacteria bacterium RIFCSPLOWO2_02_FULL_53_8]|nr:MAG: hypothetical protein A3J24_03915 [Deltaproteobacteria bacterium RIFCSPLOWO2_02_FULL_53_8]
MSEDIQMLFAIGLGVLCLVSVALLRSASKSRAELMRFRESMAVKLDAHALQRQELSEQASEGLRDINDKLVAVEQHLADIRVVTDVIYKYKLPSKADRDFLDQIEIDNEVSEGISQAGERRNA